MKGGFIAVECLDARDVRDKHVRKPKAKVGARVGKTVATQYFHIGEDAVQPEETDMTDAGVDDGMRC